MHRTVVEQLCYHRREHNKDTASAASARHAVVQYEQDIELGRESGFHQTFVIGILCYRNITRCEVHNSWSCRIH